MKWKDKLTGFLPGDKIIAINNHYAITIKNNGHGIVISKEEAIKHDIVNLGRDVYVHWYLPNGSDAGYFNVNSKYFKRGEHMNTPMKENV